MINILVTILVQNCTKSFQKEFFCPQFNTLGFLSASIIASSTPVFIHREWCYYDITELHTRLPFTRSIAAWSILMRSTLTKSTSFMGQDIMCKHQKSLDHVEINFFYGTRHNVQTPKKLWSCWNQLLLWDKT